MLHAVTVAAEKLRAWRLELGISQVRAAELIGVSAAAVCDWEKGKKIPRLAQAEKVARATSGAVPMLDWVEVAA